MGIQEFRLAGRNGDGRHPYINEAGAFLGEGTPLLQRDLDRRWKPRDPVTLSWLLAKGYGTEIDFMPKTDGLATVARALNRGDRSLAAIALVHCAFPPVPSADGARRMREADSVLMKYNPDWADEPRVPGGEGGGEWTVEGSTAVEQSTQDSKSMRVSALSRDCEREWDRAYEYCRELMFTNLAGGNAANIFGPSYMSCVRGQVSAECGGNAVN